MYFSYAEALFGGIDGWDNKVLLCRFLTNKLQVINSLLRDILLLYLSFMN